MRRPVLRIEVSSTLSPDRKFSMSYFRAVPPSKQHVSYFYSGTSTVDQSWSYEPDYVRFEIFNHITKSSATRVGFHALITP
jgi:hypothetical protein